jgi:hypothetical protein
MKRLYFFAGSILTVTLLTAFNAKETGTISNYTKTLFHNKNSGGAGPGRTGAPGEQNCTGCHAGTAQDGSNVNLITLLQGATPITSYVPGANYTVALSMSTAAAKKGFQATVLDASGNMAGDFTAGLNTQVNGTTRKYANHTSASNTSATTLWGWTWQAPSTNVGDVTFYVATNETNNNGNDNGDVIYLSQHIFSAQSGAGIEENEIDNNFMAGYSASKNSVVITCNTLVSGAMSMNLFDMSGKLIYSKYIGQSIPGQIKENVQLPTVIESGMYVVNFFIDNTAFSTNIYID